MAKARKATAEQIAMCEHVSAEYSAKIAAERTALHTGLRANNSMASLALIERLEDEMSEKIAAILNGARW